MIFISLFNLYKGGSLEIYSAIIKHIGTREDVYGISFENNNLTRVYCCPYPIRLFNVPYRFFLEQFVVPIMAKIIGAKILIMMGNFPALLWPNEQRVFLHNVLYFRKPNGLKMLVETCLFDLMMRLKKPKIFVQTDHMRDVVKNKYPYLDVDVVGHPLELNESPARTVAKPTLIVYPAHDYPHKNHRFLLDNIDKYNRIDNINIVFTIDKPEYFESVTELIEFTGSLSRNDVKNLVDKSSALLFLSSDESLGVPLVEAAVAKLPVIAPNLAYVDAVLSNYYSFSLNDPDSLAFALQQYCSDRVNSKVKLPNCKINTSPNNFINRLFKRA